MTFSSCIYKYQSENKRFDCKMQWTSKLCKSLHL